MNAPLVPLLPAIAELAKLDQWVISKNIRRGKRVVKPPFSVQLDAKYREPWKCDINNPAYWSSYAAAYAALKGFQWLGFQWLGFVFDESDPYTGVDLDGCCKPDRMRIQTRDDIEPWALRINDLLDSYTEISPSGTGVKIFVRGALAESLTYSLGVHKGMEIYSQKRFFTVTGCHLPEMPTEIRDAQAALDQLEREFRLARPSRQSSIPNPARTITHSQWYSGERASLDDVRADFNAQHPLDQLLLSYGARQTSSKDFSCPFCEHTHTNTLFTYNDRVFSRSPNCKIPQKLGLDAFGLYCLIEHSDNVIAALKALNPIKSRKHTIEQPPLLEPEPRQRSAAQIADAQRKREARAGEAEEIRESVKRRAQEDERLTPCDHATLNAMLDWAAEQGGACCWLGRAAIAKRAQYSEGAVKRSVMRLEQFGYFKSSGKGGRPIDTARRTFSRGSCLQPETIVVENKDPREKDLQLVDAEDRTISRGSCLQPETIVVENKDPRIDLASDHDYTHGASEGGRASAAAVELVAQEPSAEAWRLSCDKRGMYFLRGPGGVARPVGFDSERAEQILAEKRGRPAQVAALGTQEALNQTEAIYEPNAALPPSGRDYTGRVKDLQGFTECYEAATDSIRVRQGVADVADLEHELDQHQLLGPPLPASLRPNRVSATDRYRADLALMPASKLAEERKKHKATLKKYAGEVWLASVRAKLELVEAEIELRKRSTQAMRADADRRAAPPHKLPKRVRTVQDFPKPVKLPDANIARDRT